MYSLESIMTCKRSAISNPMVTVYVWRKRFAKFVLRIGHSDVGDVNSTCKASSGSSQMCPFCCMTYMS